MKRVKLIMTLGIVALTALVVGAILMVRSDALHLRVFPVTAADETVATRHTDQTPTLNGQNRLLYVQPLAPADAALQQSTKQGLSYAKVGYDDIQAAEIAGQKPDHATLLIADPDIATYEDAVIDFVEAGGSAVFMQRLEEISPRLQQLLGLTAVGGVRRVTGIKFDEPIYPGYPNASVEDSSAFAHRAADVKLAASATTLISASSRPILVENQTAGGQVQYWNTGFLNDRLARGLFVQSVGRLFPVAVTSQAGIQVMHIDDFPAPVPDTTTTVADASGKAMTVADFYAHRWWPDMLRLGRKYDLKYTGALIGTYDNDVSGSDAELYGAMRRTGQKYVRELNKVGGEVSLHGFNHQPLLLAKDPVDQKLNYTPWPDQASMAAGLDQVAELMATLAPARAITTYVPPSNLTSKTGLAAVRQVFPKVDTVAALYYGDAVQSRYVTEFGENQDDPQLFDFPRNVSGYAFTTNNRYEIADVAATFGVMAHFIHPDDVFDLARSNNANWEELAESFDQQLDFVKKTYPMIRPMTQNHATAVLKQYFAGAVDVRYSDTQIELYARHMPDNASVTVRLKDGKLATGSFQDRTVRELGAGLYSVTPKRAALTLAIEKG